ncbi:MAG: sulfurtransferase TusA family protein, partial [Proteobacteria bacterium]|nr:sulfurtransferase TusA family protein [Pseudomonadota bacterium]
MAEKTIIDARGSFCPGPLMELIAAIKMVEIGDEIEILSSDKGSASEIPQWIK